jgi:hypothetical protein
MEPGEVGRENRQSRMGLASFILAIIAVVGVVVLIVISATLVSSAPGFDPNSPQIDPESAAFGALALVGFGILACLLVNLVGLGLGVAGVIQRRRKKLFAILGLVFNGLVLLGVIVLVVAGLALAPATG